jgi:eukaryotic-like serine/threonine-protein kinase
VSDLPWVHHRSWREAWREVRPAQSGGQSSSKVVARIGDEATDTCFLKLLNRQKDPERRKRFFRETSALATYSHPNIPRLVETNAFHYTDNEFKLYLVSEFIAGPTITDQVSQRGTLAFDRALALTTRLAEIVGYFCGRNLLLCLCRHPAGGS